MTDIFIPDALRQKVERASAGKRTVLYSRKRQPNVMFVVPQFRLSEVSSDLGDDIHPAFIVNNRPYDAFYYGCYPASLVQGELVSQPDRTPASLMDLPTFMAQAHQTGRGFHLSSNAEWAALMLLCQQQGFRECGNTDYGRDYRCPEQTVTRLDGRCSGDNEGLATHGTGTYHPDWQHDNTLDGISDLCGNLWEWQSGMRLVAGEIQIIRHNDAATASADDEHHWQAVNLTTGALTKLGHKESAKFDSPVHCLAGNGGTPRLSAQITHYNGDPLDNGYPSSLLDGPFNAVRCADGAAVPNLLKILGLAPYHHCEDSAQAYLRNYGQRYLMRGGAWYSQQFAGLRTLCLSHASNHKSTTVGGRIAWLPL